MGSYISSGRNWNVMSIEKNSRIEADKRMPQSEHIPLGELEDRQLFIFSYGSLFILIQNH